MWEKIKYEISGIPYFLYCVLAEALDRPATPILVALFVSIITSVLLHNPQ